MTITYQKQTDFDDNLVSISKKDNGVQICTIPLDEANKDYQEYLEWVADGNTPEEAE